MPKITLLNGNVTLYCYNDQERVIFEKRTKRDQINMIKGLHHISLKCGTEEDFARALDFYLNVLGFDLVRRWPEGAMISFGNGMLEIFNNGEGIRARGALRHIAFATDDVEGIVRKVRESGYEVFIEPKDIVIRSEPELNARMAFCYGPLGEEIEFFREL